ncbi:Nuclear transport factor 2 Eukaryote [Penicillium frequentans]|uniref:NTF2-related export protein n=1 Tax=Penicillium frequentans TaxID=3151616 RepID=A0AAD6CT14_9EURO|nr:Nuclear transport factor 2 Eukaryote [Penicillium glabrum]
MGDHNSIGNAFVSHYFNTFDNFDARANLASLYRPESMLTWEGIGLQGTQSIIERLTNPELKVVKTQISNTDSEPSINNAILVCVIGNLSSRGKKIDNAFDRPMTFAETFLLAPVPGQPGGFYIHNQNFRLIQF